MRLSNINHIEESHMSANWINLTDALTNGARINEQAADGQGFEIRHESSGLILSGLNFQHNRHTSDQINLAEHLWDPTYPHHLEEIFTDAFYGYNELSIWTSDNVLIG